jgi:YydF family exported signaling peptide
MADLSILEALEVEGNAVELADQDDLWFLINGGDGRWIAGS